MMRPAVLLALLTLPTAALAQEAALFDGRNLQMAPSDGDARDPLFLARPGRMWQGDWYGAFLWEFANAPVRETLSDGSKDMLLDDLLGVHLGGGYNVIDRLRIDASLPLTATSVTRERSPQGPGVGDLRVGAMLVLVPPKDLLEGGGLGLGLSPWIDLPTGEEDKYVASPGVGGGAKLGLTYELEKITLTAEAGLGMPARSKNSGLGVADGLLAGAAVGYLFDPHTGVNLEYRMTPTLTSDPTLGAAAPMEVMASGRRRFDDGGHLMAGFSVGLGDAAGAPMYRILIGGGYGSQTDPAPRDTDGDGIGDRTDACVDQPETVNSWKDEDGCPDSLADITLLVSFKDAPVAGAAVVLTSPEGDQPLQSTAQPIAFQAMPGIELKAAATLDGCLAGETSLTTAEGPNALTVPLTLAAPVETKIHVVDGDGAAIKGARIGWRDQAQRCVPAGVIETDPDGLATGTTGPGPHEIVVRADGFAVKKVPYESADYTGGQLEVQLDTTRIRLEEKQIVILEKVFFETGSAKILPVSFALLDEIASTLVTNPQIKVVEIQGHTDDRGNDASNLKLSQARAESVVAYLVDKGVAAERLVAKGYGETTPIASNKTNDGRGLNRRVEFQILEATTIIGPK